MRLNFCMVRIRCSILCVFDRKKTSMRMIEMYMGEPLLHASSLPFSYNRDSLSTFQFLLHTSTKPLKLITNKKSCCKNRQNEYIQSFPIRFHRLRYDFIIQPTIIKLYSSQTKLIVFLYYNAYTLLLLLGTFASKKYR